MNVLCEAYFLLEVSEHYTSSIDWYCSIPTQIYIKFHIAYEDSKGHIVSDFKSVALHYLKTPSGFALDTIFMIPIELTALIIPDVNTRNSVLQYLRIIHVSRIVRIRQLFKIEEKKLNQQWVRL